MKIAIFGRNKKAIAEYRKELKKSELTYDNKRPDIVLSLGGDGTFLMAERVYPGVPKLLIRDKNVCIKCECELMPSVIFEKLKQGKYKINEYRKLEAVFKGKRIYAINDIVLRNEKPIHAIRFAMNISGKETEELIGDGVVIATRFGSTAYYYSITKKTFDKGIGIAFNNLSREKENMNVPETSKIEIMLTRGPATLSWDNYEKYATLKAGDKVSIKLSDKVARIVKI